MTRKIPLRSPAGSARLAIMAIVASIAMGTLLAGPAAGAENKNDLLQLSRDGVHFGTDSGPRMFGSSKGFVPGETRPGLVWVRNAGKESASFSLAVHNTSAPDAGNSSGGSSVLPVHLRLHVQASGRGSAAGTLPTVGDCTPIIEGWTLAAGEVLPLTLDLGLSLHAPNSTRKQNSDFTMTFALQESGGGQQARTCSQRPETFPANVSAISLPISGAPASIGTPGVGVDRDAQDSAAAPQALPLLRQLQSNVEATVYNPWPWIVVISGCAYVFTSVRKRSRTK